MTDIPNPIDVHVGHCARKIRNRLGISQGAAAAAIGVSFQQLQKYEKAANRFSASKLFELARHFGVPVSEFFVGLEGDVARAPADAKVVAFESVVAQRETQELIQVLAQLSRPAAKAVIEVAITAAGAMCLVAEHPQLVVRTGAAEIPPAQRQLIEDAADVVGDLGHHTAQARAEANRAAEGIFLVG